MKYAEYIYLGGAVMLGIFMIQERELLDQSMKMLFFLSIAAFLGMYIFRRRRRIKLDQALREEMRRIEKELED